MGSGIQINLRIAGKRIRPTLELPPTPANLRYAERLAADLAVQIRLGTFDLATTFPNYRNAAAVAPLTGAKPVSGKTFDQVADLYLKLYGPDLEYTTRKGYERILDRYWRKALGSRPIVAITDEEVLEVRDAAKLSAKTWNNVLIPLRRVFAVALAKKFMKDDPLSLIKNRKVQKPLPDPFEVYEALSIIEQIRKRWDDATADYFDFAFATGLRTGEQIALQWSSVDLSRGEVQISRTSSWKHEKESTKTHTARMLELNPRAVAILKRQKARTQLAGRHVFVYPSSGLPYPTDAAINAKWVAALKGLQMRYRKPYTTRASSVSWNLMVGRNPLWVAQQHGHSVATMMAAYAKWIGKDGAAAETYFANERAETGQKKTA